ncbi:hypothetical protein M595_0270 [Lyngbya aestuarii BL J]|uniref:Uncharacterized protein n=1 Tax=Lyngbya aestuarii BL J TaxID=1348334 RepID=U7QRI8_9CYAN|nr:hypothetical protein M595_0270 [Lyngbya aestuarii BL J]
MLKITLRFVRMLIFGQLLASGVVYLRIDVKSSPISFSD